MGAIGLAHNFASTPAHAGLARTVLGGGRTPQPASDGARAAGDPPMGFGPDDAATAKQIAPEKGSMAPPAEMRAAPLGMTPAAVPDWTHPGEAAMERLRAGSSAAPGAPPPEADARYLANLYR